MPRYIDADYLDELITQLNHEGRGITRGEYKIIDSVLFEFPTADVVEVVRCKDCKYASPNGEYGCKAYHFKLYETHEMKADDFCSHGERRE